MTLRLPLPALADVEAAAAACMAATRLATSLDVKRRLRADGFWATQAHVSALLDAAAERCGWASGDCLAWRRVPGTDAFRRVGPYRAYWTAGTPLPQLAYAVG